MRGLLGGPGRKACRAGLGVWGALLRPEFDVRDGIEWFAALGTGAGRGEGGEVVRAVGAEAEARREECAAEVAGAPVPERQEDKDGDGAEQERHKP